jgi:hypothetical protein
MRTLVAILLLVGCGAKHAAPVEARAEQEEDVPALELGEEGDDDHMPAVLLSVAERDLHTVAMRIVAATKTTSYSHRTIVDEASGRFELDCSGFVDYALAHARPEALAAVRGSAARRPLAKDFVAFLRSLPPEGRAGWHPIATPLDLQPGDIIAWLKPVDVTSKNTGHVMIVREPPRRDRDHDDIVIVPIIDSAAVPHGKGDSRKADKRTGLGTGDVLLVVDDTSAPIGYRWSTGSKAKVHATTIALGGLR